MTTVTVPTLETERLVLRAFRPEDLARVALYWADPASRFTGGPADETDAWRSMERGMGHWVLRGFGAFAIVDKANGLFAGKTGGYFPGDWPEPEIGWWLLPDARGRGIATEAARRVRRWLYEENGWPTAVSYIEPDNAPSIALAERLGAVLEDTITIRGRTTHVFRHPAPDAVLQQGEAA